MLSGLCGAPSWIRTSDLRLRSPLLYPAELSGHGTIYLKRSVHISLNVLDEQYCDVLFLQSTAPAELSGYRDGNVKNGAGGESLTRVACLEGRSNKRYTTPAKC